MLFPGIEVEAAGQWENCPGALHHEILFRSLGRVATTYVLQGKNVSLVHRLFSPKCLFLQIHKVKLGYFIFKDVSGLFPMAFALFLFALTQLTTHSLKSIFRLASVTLFFHSHPSSSLMFTFHFHGFFSPSHLSLGESLILGP